MYSIVQQSIRRYRVFPPSGNILLKIGYKKGMLMARTVIIMRRQKPLLLSTACLSLTTIAAVILWRSLVWARLTPKILCKPEKK